MLVEINGQGAVLLDSGCMTDAISPEIVQIVGLKVHQLKIKYPFNWVLKGVKPK